MKTVLIDTTEVIEKYMKTQIALHPFCFVFWAIGENLIWKEVSAVVGKDIEPKNDIDNKILIISAKDMGEMNSLWAKILSQEIQPHVEAYKDGNQFTW
jgi:hypothetical protein